MTCVCHRVLSPLSERGRQRECEQHNMTTETTTDTARSCDSAGVCSCIGQRRDREDEHREGEHQPEGAYVVGGETLPPVFKAADHERQAEH